jgi:hypothetical protein
MLVVLGVFAGMCVLAGLIGLVLLGQAPTSPKTVTATGLGAPTTTAYPAAPASEVERIRTALHDMGARCTPGADSVTQQQIGADVDVLISFAGRYPDARFTIDDETGRALDLLLIARDEMQTCAPAAAQRANQLLPSQFRTAPSAPDRIATSGG